MTEKTINKSVVQKEWLGKPKGLKHQLDNADKLQQIECPNEECEITLEFYPDKLYWESDDEFEFETGYCPECKQEFQICANAGVQEYDFFTT